MRAQRLTLKRWPSDRWGALRRKRSQPERTRLSRHSLRSTIPDHRHQFNDLKPDMLKGPVRNERERLCGNTFVACPCSYPIASDSCAVLPINGAQSDCARKSSVGALVMQTRLLPHDPRDRHASRSTTMRVPSYGHGIVAVHLETAVIDTPLSRPQRRRSRMGEQESSAPSAES